MEKLFLKLMLILNFSVGLSAMADPNMSMYAKAFNQNAHNSKWKSLVSDLNALKETTLKYEGNNIGPINQAASALAFIYVETQKAAGGKPLNPEVVRSNLIKNAQEFGVFEILLMPLLEGINESVKGRRFENAALLNPILNRLNPILAAKFAKEFNLPVSEEFYLKNSDQFKNKYGWNEFPDTRALKKKAFDYENCYNSIGPGCMKAMAGGATGGGFAGGTAWGWSGPGAAFGAASGAAVGAGYQFLKNPNCAPARSACMGGYDPMNPYPKGR